MTSKSDPVSTGDAGESAVRARLQRLQWNVWPTDNRDKGTDLIVMTSDSGRHGAFGVQVKTGPSYFKSPKRDGGGSVTGWWYAESSPEHFDYWTGHTMPHILVLYDDDADTAYWVHVTPDKVTSTGKGRKILVPRARTVDGDHRSELLAVARRQGSFPTLEGTAFSAAAENIGPEAQLRYALIAPRLLAPHRNAGHQNPITAVEAVALLAQGRFRDLVAFAEQHAEVPDPREEPPVGSDWAWSFAKAIWDWATTDSVDRLRTSLASAPREKEKAASGVLFACALQRVHSHDEGMEPQTRQSEAMAVLDDLVEGGELEASDLGWVLVQRARTNIEAGWEEEAESDAAGALSKFVGPSDVTTTALAAAARATVWGIVAARNFEEADLGGLVTASDNAVSWWRSQTISQGLTAAVDKHFDSWAERRFLFQIGGEGGNHDLFAAELSADLQGDHGIWRHIASLGARHRMMNSGSVPNEVDELVEGLDALRGCGDERSLESAIAHLRRVGPIEAVAKSVNKISRDGWTRTTAPANFSTLRMAGDLINEQTATDILAWIARSVSVDRTEYDERVLKTVLVERSVFGAAEGLMHSADNSTHQTVAKAIVALPEPQLDHSVSRLPNIIWKLDFDQVALPERSALSELGWRDQGRVGVAILGWLAANNDLAALGELTRRAVNGDLDALDGIGLDALSDADAEPIIEHLERAVQATLSSARSGSLSIGGPDNSGVLTQLNLRFPTVARWAPIIQLLCEPRVLEADKRSPCSLIVESPHLLPESARDSLAENVDSLGKGLQAFGSPSDSGMGVAISIALHVINGPDADRAIAELACGAPRRRQSAALVIGAGHQPNMQPTLLGLAGDADFEVRHEAAAAVGKLVAASPSPEIAELARHIADDRGTDLPEMLLIGLAQHYQALSGIGVEIAQQLAGSPSARVRHRANRLLSRHSGPSTTPS